MHVESILQSRANKKIEQPGVRAALALTGFRSFRSSSLSRKVFVKFNLGLKNRVWF